MQNNPLLNNIAFDLVKDKVIADKMKEYKAETQNFQEAKLPQQQPEKKDDDIDFDEVDSEEERIMQREAEKRMAKAEKKEKIKKQQLDEKYSSLL